MDQIDTTAVGALMPTPAVAAAREQHVDGARGRIEVEGGNEGVGGGGGVEAGLGPTQMKSRSFGRSAGLACRS